MKTKQRLPGLLALLTALGLLLGLMVLLEAGKPEPDDPVLATEPLIRPNPYGPGDFVTNDRGFLECTAGRAILGIDVSSYQEEIQWAAVPQSGVEFAMIRVGYRGYSEGGLHPDTLARENYEGARAAGLDVGVYFFSQAVSVEEALEEAQFVLEAIRGWGLDMPVVFDWEYVGPEARTCDMDARTLTDLTNAFCQAIQDAGYTPMIYFNLSQSRDLLYLEELTQWEWWLAQYDTELDFPYAVDMWQYSSMGFVSGVPAAVDLNLWFP